MKNFFLGILATIFGLVLLAAIMDISDEVEDNKIENETSTEIKKSDETVVPVNVIRSTDLEAWPLTVDSVIVECHYSPKVVISVDGKLYGLTGAASRNPLPDYEQMSVETVIWANNPDFPDTKLSLSPLINKALEICK